MKKVGFSGMEKRKHPRMTFPTALRPTFQTGGQTFKVKDISKGGLKFCHQERIKIQGWVKGTMDLFEDSAVELEGIVVQINDNEMGLWFIGELEDHVYNQITDQCNNSTANTP